MEFDCSEANWKVAATELEDGSEVFDVVGTSEDQRIVFNCVDLNAALKLTKALEGVFGFSTE